MEEPMDWYDELDINFLRPADTNDWYDLPDDCYEYGEGLRDYWLDEQADAYHDYMFDDLNEEYDNE
jgi:hypothetical protein